MARKLLANDDKRREKHQRSTYPSSWDAPLFDSPFEIRRLRVLNAIGLALPRIGGKLDYLGKEARKLSLHVGSQTMELMLDHPSAKPNQWGEWSTRPGPVDTLKLELKPRFTEDIPKRVWIDGEDGKLEDQLTEILVAFGVAGEAHYRQGRIAHHAYLLKRRADNEAEVVKPRAEAERLAREKREREAKARRDMLLGHRLGLVAHGRQQDLQRGQPLLAINHFRTRYAGSDDPRDVEHHRAQEVRALGGAGPGLKTGVRLSLQVLPEGRPLLVLPPDVRPLVERYDVPPLAMEQIVDSQLVGFHRAPLGSNLTAPSRRD
jgi:hypothetical protein